MKTKKSQFAVYFAGGYAYSEKKDDELLLPPEVEIEKKQINVNAMNDENELLLPPM